MPATITLQAAPQDYNLVVGSNVYTLGSISANEDAYVLQIEQYFETTGTSTSIATIQQPANPAGVAHFDVSKILQSYMDIAFVEKTQDVAETAGETLTYRVRWGSVTDDVITFNGTSAIKRIFNGYVDWRQLNWTGYNAFFHTTAATVPCLCEVPPCEINTQFVARANYLHNYPNSSIPVRSSVYHTLSFANRLANYDNGSQYGNNEQPWAVQIKMYDIGDNLIQTTIYVISEQKGLGPRSTFSDTSIGNYKDSEWIGTLGAGPQNLKDAGYWPQSSAAIWNQVSQVWGNYSQIWNLASSTAIVDHYTVDIMSVNMCYWGENGAPANDNATTLEPYLGSVLYRQEFQLSDPCTGYDPVTVSFVNQYGVKDYFTFDRRNTYNQNIRRNNYTQVLGSWSDATYTIDPHGRGQRTFSTQIQTNMTMSSYWMGDEESAWLEELFTSPHIQVYYNGVWEPAVITSNTYEQKTNVRNGLFQHTLNVQFANNKKVQRG
jgi:hypothetical protein